MRYLMVCLALLLVACVPTREMAVYVSEPIVGPKEIALVGNRAPWVIEIEKRLRAEGVAIKRFASLGEATKQTSETQTETTATTTTRIILVLDGFAPNTGMTRCFAGGYNFGYINAEIIDSKNNETLSVYSNSGYSEDCPPLSGTIFGDITDMVLATFK